MDKNPADSAETSQTDAPLQAGPAAGAATDYRVLARKYRPGGFDQMIGQDALVRTLTNAIRSGRMAHAFILTGVRGIGKTTAARIIARALNCTGADDAGGPTPHPCGQCNACISIAADRNVDVIEIDAASNTGVDNIREIIEAVRYAPVSARYKVYIIDEVHMLSRAAFNSLLKTLEEPPDHAKFIFATTEIRKVPVTVLSRCQRFDLRRVDSAVLQQYFAQIVGLEHASIEADALGMIARAADGSVRDGLSLLDQAISQAEPPDPASPSAGSGAPALTVTGDQVRRMLGLADRSRIIDLFDALVTARPADALAIAADMNADGADPVVIAQDLLDFTHFLTRLKVVPDVASDPTLPEAEKTRGGALAGALSMPILTRCWQILLKGLGEIQIAPDPADALDMVLIRLVHGGTLPTPDDLLKKLALVAPDEPSQGPDRTPGKTPDRTSDAPSGDTGPRTATASGSGSGSGAAMQTVQSVAGEPRGGAPRAMASTSGAASPRRQHQTEPETFSIARPEGASRAAAEPRSSGSSLPSNYRDLVELVAERSDPLMHAHLYSFVHVVRYEPGLLDFRPRQGAPESLPGQIRQLLRSLSGENNWMVSVSSAEGEPTLSEQDAEIHRRRLERASGHPIVQALFSSFPKAQILDLQAVRGLPSAGAVSRAGLAAGAATGGPDSVSGHPPGRGDFQGLENAIYDDMSHGGGPVDSDRDFYPDDIPDSMPDDVNYYDEHDFE